MEDLTGMSREDLADHLSRLKEDLEEINEERMFTLSQTGLHVSAGAVKKFQTQIEHLEAKIAEVEEAIRDRSA